jgi:hypothetical protein
MIAEDGKSDRAIAAEIGDVAPRDIAISASTRTP